MKGRVGGLEGMVVEGLEGMVVEGLKGLEGVVD